MRQLFRIRLRIFGQHREQRFRCALRIGVHPVRMQGECADPAAALDLPRSRVKIKADHHRHRRAADRNEFRLLVMRRRNDIRNEFFIIAEDRVQLRETGDIDHRRLILPARLIVRRVGRIHAGCIMHGDQSAQLIERRADAGGICCIAGNDRSNILHTRPVSRCAAEARPSAAAGRSACRSRSP